MTSPIVAGLYIVATPIGNMGDMTTRAVEILGAADVVACEDTRVTAKLLRHHGLTTRLERYDEHSAPRARPKLLARLDAGEVVALVSDAGTPLISDPGYKLVREAVELGHAVMPAPGASSVMAALSVAGLPTDRFMFAGFLAPKQGKRRAALTELAKIDATLVLLESPKRLAAALADMALVLGPRPAAVARELTKLYEEVRRGTLDDLARTYAEEDTPRGEIVIVIAPADGAPAQVDLEALLLVALEGHSVKEATALVTAQTGLPRKTVYAQALISTKGPQGPSGPKRR